MIAEIGICTGDLEKSARFWQACLGSVEHGDLDSGVENTVFPAGARGYGRVRLWPTDVDLVATLADNPQPAGWRAAEVLVDDLDETFARVEPHATRVLGQPRWLGGKPEEGIRAAQVVGPSGEIVYLTQVDSSIFAHELPTDRREPGVFIMVLGTWLLDDSSAHLERHGFRELNRSNPVITSLNLIQNSPDAQTSSAFHEVGGGTFIEVNQYQGESAGAGGGPIRYVLFSGGSNDVSIGPNAEVIIGATTSQTNGPVG